MIGLPSQLMASASGSVAAAAESTVGLPPDMIGFVVLALIAVPVIVLVSSAMFAAPRNTKVPLLFLASVGILVSATIVGFAAFGALLGLVFPK